MIILSWGLIIGIPIVYVKFESMRKYITASLWGLAILYGILVIWHTIKNGSPGELAAWILIIAAVVVLVWRETIVRHVPQPIKRGYSVVVQIVTSIGEMLDRLIDVLTVPFIIFVWIPFCAVIGYVSIIQAIEYFGLKPPLSTVWSKVTSISKMDVALILLGLITMLMIGIFARLGNKR